MWILYWMQQSVPPPSTVWATGLMRYCLTQKGRSSWSEAILSHSSFSTRLRSLSLAHTHSARMIKRFDGFGGGSSGGSR